MIGLLLSSCPRTGQRGAPARRSVDRFGGSSLAEPFERDGRQVALGERRQSVAIIGAGFTGSLLAVHLLREARAPVALDIVDKRAGLGPGLAYATDNVFHLLNVRAGNMSAFPDAPAHFVDWLSRIKDAAAPEGVAGDSGYAFVPRRLYGAYLREQLDAAIAGAGHGSRCRARAASAVDVDSLGSGFALRLSTGETLHVDTVALCLGNFPPKLPCELPADAHPDQVVADPWAEGALAGIRNEAAVLILGTGLTMVDAVLSLLDRGHTGPITALSRRGLLPHRHTNAEAYRDFFKERGALPTTTAAILRALRGEARAAAANGDNWRSVVDATRPYLLRLWDALPPAERRRFLPTPDPTGKSTATAWRRMSPPGSTPPATAAS